MFKNTCRSQLYLSSCSLQWDVLDHDQEVRYELRDILEETGFMFPSWMYLDFCF